MGSKPDGNAVGCFIVLAFIMIVGVITQLKEEGETIQYIGVGVVLAIIIFVLIKSSRDSLKKQKENDDKLEKLGFTRHYEAGTYLTGFQESERQSNVICGETKDELIFLDSDLNELGKIPIKDITDITLEDKSTIDKRITLTRIALVGIFAFGLQKKRKDEVYFLVIDWKSKKLGETVVFEFTNLEDVNKAMFNIKKRVNEL